MYGLAASPSANVLIEESINGWKEFELGIAILREVGVDTGGCNIQFAVNPQDGRLIVVEMNPRV
jgi:carbamoylphosphate synthase large subunit